MNISNLFGNTTNYISPVIDPFNNNSIKQVSLNVTKDIWGDKITFRCWGYVSFKNQNTEGQQNFEASTFEELIIQVKAFVENLK